MCAMKVGIVGAAGRMGRMLIAEVLAEPEATLCGAIARADSAIVGQDAGLLAGHAAAGVAVGADPVALFAAAEAVIDFTRPSASCAHARLAAQAHVPLVVGTTGFSPAEREEIERAAEHTPIFIAANMSVGVTLLAALTEKVAAVLGPDYDIEIIEMHHRHKVDAPSGTALALGEAAARGRGVPLPSVWRKSRDGHTGARPAGEIGFATLRGGDVVGDHTVMFAAEGERIELTHKASSRGVFSRGAVKAALWCRGRPPGLYGMRDLLGL